MGACRPRKLADTLVELREFSREDIEVLSDPTAEQVRWALDRAAMRTAGAAGQSLFILYGAGGPSSSTTTTATAHADEVPGGTVMLWTLPYPRVTIRAS